MTAVVVIFLVGVFTALGIWFSIVRSKRKALGDIDSRFWELIGHEREHFDDNDDLEGV